MPTVSSEMISVDTLQIQPAAGAFRDGSILMPHADTGSVATAADLWSSSALNWGLMALCIILVILYLRRLISVLPYIAGGMVRWREFLSLEGNMRLSRERDSVAVVSVLAVSMCISRLGLFRADFLDSLQPGIRTLATIGIVLAFIALRAILATAMPQGKMRSDTIRLAGRCGANFLIMLTLIFLILLIISSVSAGCQTFAVKAAYYVTGAIWALFLLRKYQIVSQDNGQFTAILYLCGIEIIPAVLLVASMIYL